ncbi:hypothetical protein PR202_gb25452 [Eleusine coracana subsp. coracana]|uniref:Uncharacterized protein n=1 Tax=Eleusine coracana subsp. coracana TaxID=191504 RepID=A0AAV5FPA4_ELECO|nr:hypothetical protein PR202_gb25452 [Eleusine coracana subsp. coracana]
MEEYDDEEEEDGYEFVGAEDAMQFVEMAERSTAARAHDYEEVAARKRKALTEEQPHSAVVHFVSRKEESSKRLRKDDLSEAEAATMFDQLMEGFGLRRRKRSREAIPILHEIVRIVPNLPNSYYLLGSIYDETGELDKAINFMMLEASVSPKDASLWKKLVVLARKKDDAPLARYCILKAMRADPEDTGLKYVGADIYHKLHDYQKAAVIYEQIVKVDPANVFVRKVTAQMYRDCGQIDKAINLLEEYVNTRSTNMDWSLLDLLISLYLRDNAVSEALKQIEKAHLLLGFEHKLPVKLQAKAVVYHAYLGDMKHAEVLVAVKKAGDQDGEANCPLS